MSSSSRGLRLCLGLSGGLLLSAAVASALLVSAGDADEPSRAVYDRIKMGMAQQEAEAILGDWPQHLMRGRADSITVGWEAPDGAMIEVDFDAHDRVTGKHFAEGDQPFAARMKRIIKRFPFR